MKKLVYLVVTGLLIITASLVSAYRVSYKKEFDTIKIEGGLITGTLEVQGGIHIYKGIPFAAPPVGSLRWKEPMPVIPWKGIRICTTFGASPMQGVPSPFGPWSEEYLIPKEPISEDCLYLNVWTGAKKANEKRPVLVWIYGGGFVSGGSGCAIYDGEAMAHKGIVFVSLNYRVGVFGFFAYPELTKESSHHVSGNYGLLDQIAALKWVQRNIAAFGGDPNNVTIAGQSAGSMSVNCLVASPLCKGLFQRAIAESGAGFVKGPFGSRPELKSAETSGTGIAQKLNVKSLADLRKIPAQELFQKANASIGPVIDGYVLPRSIAEIFASGKQNDVPVLTGWNLDDGVAFGKLKTAVEFKQQAERQYGADALTLLQYYPANNDDEAALSQSYLSRDMLIGMQNYSWGVVQSGKGKSKIYLYFFTRKLPATGEYVKYGAFHTGEVAYAYDNLSKVNRCPWEPVDHQLANTISGYWANFVATGDPNAKGLPVWPAFNTKDYNVVILGDKVEAKPLPGKGGLDFLVAKAESDKLKY